KNSGTTFSGLPPRNTARSSTSTSLTSRKPRSNGAFSLETRKVIFADGKFSRSALMAGSVNTTSPMALSRMSRIFSIGLQMPVEAMFATRDFFADSFFQQAVVSSEVRATGGRVPEGKTKRATTQIPPLEAGVEQARGPFGILAAPAGKILVVAVDAHQVIAPDGQIAAADATQMIFYFADGERPAEGIFQAGNLILQNGAAAVGGKIIFAKPCGGFLFDQRAMALNKKTAPTGSAMVGDKIRVRHRVAIKENQIVAGGGGNGLVQDLRPAKIFVRLPEMRGAEFLLCRPARKKFTRRLLRSVIGEQHFVRRHDLPRDGGQHARQIIRLIKGVDDQRNFHA